MIKTASFDIYYHQLLTETGELTGELPSFADNKQTLIDLYQTMVQMRAYDTKAIALQRTGKMGTYASIHGQEAISTATGHAMAKNDVLAPYYRDYAAQIQRGTNMSDIYQYWGGDERGSAHENQGEDFPIAVPIATQCLHATGIAFAFKYRKESRVAVTSIGEGGTSEGEFYEALNVAGAWNLPVVFIINNNQWAISVPREKQTACQTFAQKAIAAGIEGVQVDGNDILACRKIIGEKIDKARRGDGPTVIEAITFRLCDHTTADDATRYQPSEQYDEAKAKEPIIRFKHYLESQDLWDDEKESALLETCQKNVNQAVQTYENLDMPELASIFDYHYHTLPDDLIEQREYALAQRNENHA
tara:strand:- start:88 stop:1167 length:1080 start_codon:yes stop_codon:yes gene_type:complete